uniref:Uncharacterized protein n=1 Tax=Sphaerodactylus townsendi TaxID=933632 RepID=A0ACB8EQG7_9SAUR
MHVLAWNEYGDGAFSKLSQLGMVLAAAGGSCVKPPPLNGIHDGCQQTQKGREMRLVVSADKLETILALLELLSEFIPGIHFEVLAISGKDPEMAVPLSSLLCDTTDGVPVASEGDLASSGQSMSSSERKSELQFLSIVLA